MYSKKEEIIKLFKELSEEEKIEVKNKINNITINKNNIENKIEYEVISSLTWF
jgi:hypothetical protein